MLRFILIIFRELLNINKTCIKLSWIIKYIKFVYKICADITDI